MNVEPHMVVVGNVVSGFRFYGPFDDYDSALNWGKGITDEDWHIALMEEPGED